MIFNILIIILIFQKRQLKAIRFYIISNLLISDLFFLCICAVTIIVLINRGFFPILHSTNILKCILHSLSLCAHISSLCTTVFLAVDRYTAVKYSLQYHLILTPKRIFLILSLIWLSSITISALLWINTSDYERFLYRKNVILIVLRLSLSMFLLATSKYTDVIRKRHIREIEKRQNTFGEKKEKLEKNVLLKLMISRRMIRWSGFILGCKTFWFFNGFY